MGAPFRQTRTKLRQAAYNIKGHIGRGNHEARGGLQKLDGAIQTAKAVHSVVAPLINHTQQGALFNENMKHFNQKLRRYTV